MRHLPLLAALGVWVVLLGQLAARQRVPTASDALEVPLAAAALSEGPAEEWFGLYLGERKIGHARRARQAIPNGHRLEDLAQLDVTLLGVPQRLETRLVAEIDAAQRLRRFSFLLSSPATTLAAEGEQDAEGLRVQLDVDGHSQSVDIPLAEPVTLPLTLRPRIAARWPAAGSRFRHEVIDPLTLRPQALVTEVEGVEIRGGVETLRLRETQRGLEARVWVDKHGRVVREESGLGLAMVAEPRDEALRGGGSEPPIDLVLAARVPLVGRVRGDPRAAGRLRLRVTGAAAGLVPDDLPRQRLRDGVLVIEREPWPLPALAADADAGGIDPRYLAPEPFVESDDPLVMAHARAAVGAARTDEERAQRLVRWVYETMRAEPAATVPSARAVARTLRGDCNEHAVLLTAMARAAGIPARVVAGAMYAEQGFVYHAWTELWLGRWVTADATLGQLPVDATHVKLVEGGPAEHLALGALLGRLGFEVVDEDA